MKSGPGSSSDPFLPSTNRPATMSTDRPPFPDRNGDEADASPVWSQRRRDLQKQWKQARAAYRAAGAPFGTSLRGLDVWIQFGRQGTSN